MSKVLSKANVKVYLLKFPKRALFFLTLFERVAAVVGVLPFKALLSDFLALVDLFILAGVLIGD